jgi:hypothetical protein
MSFLSLTLTFLFVIASTFLADSQVIDYNIDYINQPVDHFSLNSQTWGQKVLVNGDFWTGAEEKGPIIFMTGCEEDIVDTFEGNGFFNDEVIPQLGAYAIYAEHRYYGDSLPFGNDSFLEENLPYLTPEQALADFAQLIPYYKNQILNCSECAVIVYGGSYCGMLAAWMRMKHPELVDGAMASSAPIRMFDAVVDPEAFYAKSTEVFNSTNISGCADIIKIGFQNIQEFISESSTDYQEFNANINFCTPMSSINDVYTLRNWLFGSISEVSYANQMVNEGYYAGYRLSEVECLNYENLTVDSSIGEIFSTMVDAVRQTSGEYTTTCFDLFSNDAVGASPSGDDVVAADPWSVLTCGQLAISLGADGIHDMYFPDLWNSTSIEQNCIESYNITPQFTWPLDTFGGRNISDYAVYSNIIFVNGKNDPWMTGGVTQNISDSVVAYLVEDGCHVNDMYGSTPYDSDSLKFVRAKEIEYMQKWISEKQSPKNNPNPSPSDNSPTFKEILYLIIIVAVVIVFFIAFLRIRKAKSQRSAASQQPLVEARHSIQELQNKSLVVVDNGGKTN